MSSQVTSFEQSRYHRPKSVCLFVLKEQSKLVRILFVLFYVLQLLCFSKECGPIKQKSSLQTAATIIGKNKFCKGLEIKCDTRLRERKYGVAEGRPLTDLKAMAKAAGEQCPTFTPSGGETLDEVRERARDFFEFLCQLAVELEQKDQEMHGAASRSSGTCEEESVFPWTDHCGVRKLSSDNGEASKLLLDANILVVSHGAYMRNWIGYFVSDLKCTLPASLTKTQLSSVSPNTGVSHFIIKLENRSVLKPEIICVCLNQDSHLVDVGAECVAPKMF
uniref:TP53 induced glycolysis regulatory phosphatase n=1 Tax=Gallus gallus TaxID=9031 RepID=A0A8V0ZRN0_CHICK